MVVGEQTSGEGCSTSAVTLTGVWALSFFAAVPSSNPSPCLAKDKQMKRVAVLLLLLSLTIPVPAFARGAHSSGSHSRAARAVARNKYGRIKRSSAAKHAFERQHACPSTGEDIRPLLRLRC